MKKIFNSIYTKKDSHGKEKFQAGKLAAHILILVFIWKVVLGSFVIVGPGERGVVVQLGAVQDRILDEGIHFVIPVVETVKMMDVTIQKAEEAVDAASKDLQSVTSTIAVNYHLDPDKVNSVYQEVRQSYDSRLIDPALEESVKAATAQFTAEELITQRALVRDEMRTSLSDRLEEYGIVVDELSIVDFSFSSAFDAAIEAKVTAEQEALAAENKLKQIEFEAQQRIVAAEAEAEAIRIQAEAVTSQGGEDYVKLQWIQQWNGQLPSTYMSGSDDTSVFIGL